MIKINITNYLKDIVVIIMLKSLNQICALNDQILNIININIIHITFCLIPSYSFHRFIVYFHLID